MEIEQGALTPETAASERASLIGNADFRAAAMNPASAEWGRIQALDRAIAGAAEADPEEAAQPVPPGASDGGTDDDDAAAAAAFFKPPESPSAYQLPMHDAQQQGLAVNFEAEQEMRTAFHAAGVDQTLAVSLYTAAIGAAKQPRDDVQLEGERVTTEQGLRAAWKGDYEANVALAAGEARRIFAAMPESITGGASYKDWIEASGLGSNKPLIQQLHARAKARAKR